MNKQQLKKKKRKENKKTQRRWKRALVWLRGRESRTGRFASLKKLQTRKKVANEREKEEWANVKDARGRESGWSSGRAVSRKDRKVGRGKAGPSNWKRKRKKKERVEEGESDGRKKKQDGERNFDEERGEQESSGR